MAAGAASSPSQSKAPRAGAWAAECGIAASASEGKAKEDRRLHGRAKARGLKSKRAADRRAPRCKGACSTPRRFQDRFLTHGKLRTPGLQGATTANPAPDNSVVCRRSGAAAGPGRKLRARAPGADPCEACSLPSAKCKMRCPAMLLINTTNFIYVVAASTAKEVICVYLLSRAGLRKAPSAGNGGPGPASYRPSASARANRGILKSRERGQRRAVSRPRDVEFTVLLPCLPPIAPGTAQRDPPNTMLSSRPQNLALIKKRRQIDRPHSAIWFANWSLAGEEGDPANENFRELIRSGSGERASSE